MYNSGNIEQMDIEQYLNSKGIHIIGEHNGEITTHCPFNGCDEDSKGAEAHFYINKQTGLYHCFKCEAKGNKVELAKHFGDWQRTSWTDNMGVSKKTQNATNDTQTIVTTKSVKPFRGKSNYSAMEKFHSDLSEEMRQYLNQRGLTDTTIDTAKIGQANIYGQNWLTIPVYVINGELEFFKLRCMPSNEGKSAKYKNWSLNGSNQTTLYGGFKLRSERKETAIITEGEFDALIANQKGLPMTVSSTGGASTFKEEWLQCFESVRTLYVALDNDDKGRMGAQKIISLINERYPNMTIFQVCYPEGVKDMTEYFLKKYTANDLLTKYSTHVVGPEPINPTEFRELGLEDLETILNTTIKHDKYNKCTLFLAMLTAYTERDQVNIIMNGQSSSGKTYLMDAVASYFPDEDKIELADASPTSFIHDTPVVDNSTGKNYIDLERKLLLFKDMPNYQLLAKLRPLLSHDDKELCYKTTDKGKKENLQTKQTILRGFPVCVTCSAKSNMDEQESTRSIVLSPEVNAAKIEEAKKLISASMSNPQEYQRNIMNDKNRQSLEDRIRYIKSLNIKSVIIPERYKAQREFDSMINGKPLPRHQRDLQHFISLVKAATMLNAHARSNHKGDIIATDSDFEMAKTLWQELYKSASLGISPYLYDFYKKYILPAYKNRECSEGASRQEIKAEYSKEAGGLISDDKLRKDIIPALLNAGVVTEAQKPNDKRTKLIVPLVPADESICDTSNTIKQQTTERIDDITQQEIGTKTDERVISPDMLDRYDTQAYDVQGNTPYHYDDMESMEDAGGIKIEDIPF